MSSAAAWSYTRQATHWPRLGSDDWSRIATYGDPVTFACDYKAEALRVTDDAGQEFTSRMQVYTERATVKPGDFVGIGVFAQASPIGVDGTFEVRSVRRYSDTFEQRTDDFEVIV